MVVDCELDIKFVVVIVAVVAVVSVAALVSGETVDVEWVCVVGTGPRRTAVNIV